jgi:hypothetical protein
MFLTVGAMLVISMKWSKFHILTIAAEHCPSLRPDPGAHGGATDPRVVSMERHTLPLNDDGLGLRPDRRRRPLWAERGGTRGPRKFGQNSIPAID